MLGIDCTGSGYKWFCWCHARFLSPQLTHSLITALLISEKYTCAIQFDLWITQFISRQVFSIFSFFYKNKRCNNQTKYTQGAFEIYLTSERMKKRFWISWMKLFFFKPDNRSSLKIFGGEEKRKKGTATVLNEYSLGRISHPNLQKLLQPSRSMSHDWHHHVGFSMATDENKTFIQASESTCESQEHKRTFILWLMNTTKQEKEK